MLFCSLKYREKHLWDNWGKSIMNAWLKECEVLFTQAHVNHTAHFPVSDSPIPSLSFFKVIVLKAAQLLFWTLSSLLPLYILYLHEMCSGTPVKITNNWHLCSTLKFMCIMFITLYLLFNLIIFWMKYAHNFA